MQDQSILAARAGHGAQPLGQHVDAFGEHLIVLGYAPATIRSQLQLVPDPAESVSTPPLDSVSMGCMLPD